MKPERAVHSEQLVCRKQQLLIPFQVLHTQIDFLMPLCTVCIIFFCSVFSMVECQAGRALYEVTHSSHLVTRASILAINRQKNIDVNSAICPTSKCQDFLVETAIVP